MTVDSKGRELFIVDNSVSGWTGFRYLEEWSGIAKAPQDRVHADGYAHQLTSCGRSPSW